MQSVEFGLGSGDAEAPVDAGVCSVSLQPHSANLVAERTLARDTLPEATAREDAKLNLLHVQPAAVLRIVVKIQFPGYAPGLIGHELPVQRCIAMRVQIPQDQPGLRAGLFRQPAHPMSEFLSGAPLRYRHMTPVLQWLAGQKLTAGTLLPVLMVLPPRPPVPGRERCTYIGQQLGGNLVETGRRTEGTIEFGAKLQDILHGQRETGAHPGNPSRPLLPRFEEVSFKFRRTASWDCDSTRPSSTALSARARNIQWSCPSEVGVQPKAIRWLPAWSSILRYRWPWARSLSTPSCPPSAKCNLTLNTEPRATSKTWATRNAVQPSPVLSGMRARVATRAGLLPAQTRCSDCSRNSGVSRTGDFSRPLPPSHNNTVRHRHISQTGTPESSLTGYVDRPEFDGPSLRHEANHELRPSASSEMTLQPLARVLPLVGALPPVSRMSATNARTGSVVESPGLPEQPQTLLQSNNDTGGGMALAAVTAGNPKTGMYGRSITPSEGFRPTSGGVQGQGASDFRTRGHQHVSAGVERSGKSQGGR